MGAIIKSVFALSLQGFYESVKMLMTNPVSLCGGKKGLLFAIALLQLVGAKSWEGRRRGGEVLAKEFTVQKRQAASKAKQCHCHRVISFHE